MIYCGRSLIHGVSHQFPALGGLRQQFMLTGFDCTRERRNVQRLLTALLETTSEESGVHEVDFVGCAENRPINSPARSGELSGVRILIPG